MKKIAILDTRQCWEILAIHEEIKQKVTHAIGRISLVINARAHSSDKELLNLITYQNKERTLLQSIAYLLFQYYGNDDFKKDTSKSFTGEWVSVHQSQLIQLKGIESRTQFIEAFKKLGNSLNIDFTIKIKVKEKMVKIHIKPLFQ